ncbi:unnamed protein product, partial [Ixodes persulcatus]
MGCLLQAQERESISIALHHFLSHSTLSASISKTRHICVKRLMRPSNNLKASPPAYPNLQKKKKNSFFFSFFFFFCCRHRLFRDRYIRLPYLRPLLVTECLCTTSVVASLWPAGVTFLGVPHLPT